MAHIGIQIRLIIDGTLLSNFLVLRWGSWRLTSLASFFCSVLFTTLELPDICVIDQRVSEVKTCNTDCLEIISPVTGSLWVPVDSVAIFRE